MTILGMVGAGPRLGIALSTLLLLQPLHSDSQPPLCNARQPCAVLQRVCYASQIAQSTPLQNVSIHTHAILREQYEELFQNRDCPCLLPKPSYCCWTSLKQIANDVRAGQRFMEVNGTA